MPIFSPLSSSRRQTQSCSNLPDFSSKGPLVQQLSQAGMALSQVQPSPCAAPAAMPAVQDDAIESKLNALLNDHYHRLPKQCPQLRLAFRGVHFSRNRRTLFETFVKKHPGYFKYFRAGEQAQRIKWLGRISEQRLGDFYRALKGFDEGLAQAIKKFIGDEYPDNYFSDKAKEKKLQLIARAIKTITLSGFTTAEAHSLLETVQMSGHCEANVAQWLFEQRITPQFKTLSKQKDLECLLNLIDGFDSLLSNYLSHVNAVYLAHQLDAGYLPLDDKKVHNEIIYCLQTKLDALLAERMNACHTHFLAKMERNKGEGVPRACALIKCYFENVEVDEIERLLNLLVDRLFPSGKNQAGNAAIASKLHDMATVVKNNIFVYVKDQVEQLVMDALERQLDKVAQPALSGSSSLDQLTAACDSAIRKADEQLAAASAIVDNLARGGGVDREESGNFFAGLRQRCEKKIAAKKAQLAKNLLECIEHAYAATAAAAFPRPGGNEETTRFCQRCNRAADKVSKAIRDTIERAKHASLFQGSAAELDNCQGKILRNIHAMQRPGYLRGSKLNLGWFSRGFDKLSPMKKILFGVLATVSGITVGATIIAACVLSGGTLLGVLLLGGCLGLCALGGAVGILIGGIHDGLAKDASNRELLRLFDEYFLH
jgi:hypothetical protein